MNSEAMETPIVPELIKAPFVAAEPDVFEPDTMEVPAEAIDVLPYDDLKAPVCPLIIKKPFYV